MGGALSTPERILAAAKAGDAAALSEALEFAKRALTGSDRTADVSAAMRASKLLEWSDNRGWTALVHVAHSGKAEIVEVLLAAGADVAHTVPLPSGITPLHAAAAASRRQAALLLLRAGANPFIEDGKGVTPVEAAAAAAAGNGAALARELEEFSQRQDGRGGVGGVGGGLCCLFAGKLSVKTPKKNKLMLTGGAGGRSGVEWKSRWCVALPRFPCSASSPSSSSSSVVIVRRTLSIYKSRESTAPVLRVWLDGAVAALEEEEEEEEGEDEARERPAASTSPFRSRRRFPVPLSGPRARLALHPSHPPIPPGVAAVETGEAVGGSVLRFAAASSSAGSSAASASASSAVAIIQAEEAAIAAAESVRAFVAAVNGSAVVGPLQQATPSRVAASASASASAASASASAALSAPSASSEDDVTVARRLQEQYDAEAASLLASRPLGFPSSSSSSPLAQRQPSPSPLVPPSSPPAVCPSSAPQHQRRPASAASAPSLPLHVEALTLENVAGATAAGSPSSPPTRITTTATTATPLRAGIAATATTTPPRSGIAATTTAHLSPGDGSSWRQRQTGQHQQQQQRRRDDEDNERQAPPPPPPAQAATADAIVELLSSSSSTAAAAAAAGAVKPPVAAANSGSNNDGDASSEDSECVICLAAPASSGFLHGDSLHVCCCASCASGVRDRGDACPLCREAVDRVVMRVYSTKG